MSSNEINNTATVAMQTAAPAVDVEVSNGVALLSFENGPCHYMDEQLLPMVDDAFDALQRRDDVRVIVLSNAQPGFFITHYSLSDIEKNTGIMAQMQRLKLPIRFTIGPAMALARGALALRNTTLGRPLYRAMCKHPALSGTLVYAMANRLIEKLRNSPKPVIAAIGGNAQGYGMEVAQACDFRIMVRGDYYLSQIESLVGLVPGSGGGQHLARILGTAKALEFTMLGSRIDADRALQLGLVYQAVEADQLMPAVQALAQQLARRTPESLAHIKRSINNGHDRSFSGGLRLDEQGFLLCTATPSALAAFARNQAQLDSGTSVNQALDVLEKTDLNDRSQ